ncbi:hypothetical protein ACFSM5_15075 [Lacibacterium aquatile]|uniref:Uncharacterized protein n=1 Tax=Lacibacterium aquatile TaxID=1168082 RepID=A0ABW5DST6_9PROT
MNAEEFDNVLTDVSKHFSKPGDIALAAALTRDQKIKLLAQWEYDLRELMVASEEAMSGESTGRTAEELVKVQAALDELGALQPSDKAAGPGKHSPRSSEHH